jgi:hypothetical protein
MQLIRLNTLPTGRRRGGLFVVLFEDGAEPTLTAQDRADGLIDDADLDLSHSALGV